jgi:hypothetical protein
MKETIYYGSAPCDEDCAQVGGPEYAERAYLECSLYKRQIERLVDDHYGVNRPSGVTFKLKREDHDFGFYYEVVGECRIDDEAALDVLLWVDNHLPATWDPDLKERLQHENSKLRGT